MIIKNAEITSTYLGRGCSFMIMLKTGDCINSSLIIEDDGLDFIGCKEARINIFNAILDVVGVKHWEELKGQCVRIKQENDASVSVRAIGNILFESWFDFEK